MLSSVKKQRICEDEELGITKTTCNLYLRERQRERIFLFPLYNEANLNIYGNMEGGKTEQMLEVER